MKVNRTQEGATVEVEDLGHLLGLEPARVPELMRAGEITSQFEQGIDEHAGTFRLTFWYAGKRVRLTCDDAGTVLKTMRNKTGR